ncbi:MAG: agmatinase family protein [Polyangiales bacterium]
MHFDPNAAAVPGSGVFGLPHDEASARVVLVPVPFDATTSYGKGAAKGPAAILEASRQVDLYDLETGRPYAVGIHMLEERAELHAKNEEANLLSEKIIEVAGLIEGNPDLEAALARVNAISGEVNEIVRKDVERLLAANKIVGLVGGDHAVPFGCIEAHAAKFPGLGVLHFDAHADLRPAYEGFEWSHASIMRNVVDRIPGVGKLVQVGIRDLSEEELETIDGSKGRIEAFFDVDLKRAQRRGESWDSIARKIVATLPSSVYVSFDVDGLDPALCPHTGTPVPGGLQFHEATAILEEVARSGRTIVGFDLNEVSPGEDDDWDANVGARLLYKLIGWTLVSQNLSKPRVPKG